MTWDRCRPMNLRSCLSRSSDATVGVVVTSSLGKRTTWRHRRARIGRVTTGIRIPGDQTGKCIGATPSDGILQNQVNWGEIKMINYIYNLGKIPRKWKIARVILLTKPGKDTPPPTVFCHQ
jgi:hypothetical protein